MHFQRTGIHVAVGEVDVGGAIQPGAAIPGQECERFWWVQVPKEISDPDHAALRGIPAGHSLAQGPLGAGRDVELFDAVLKPLLKVGVLLVQVQGEGRDRGWEQMKQLTVARARKGNHMHDRDDNGDQPHAGSPGA